VLVLFPTVGPVVTGARVRVGAEVLIVGVLLGADVVGECVGERDGERDGLLVAGEWDGERDGLLVAGEREGERDGLLVLGAILGADEGDLVGNEVGIGVVGPTEGCSVGTAGEVVGPHVPSTHT
jgi:hypothetical protein